MLSLRHCYCKTSNEAKGLPIWTTKFLVRVDDLRRAKVVRVSSEMAVTSAAMSTLKVTVTLFTLMSAVQKLVSCVFRIVSK